MEISRFIEAFRSLDTTLDRRHALDTLVGELTSHEWRALHAILSQHTFPFDIVGQLPHEIVALIVGYLDIAQPYSLQRVSRRWQSIMESLAVRKVGLHNWYRDTMSLHHLDSATCTRMAQRIHAFRTGKPCSHFMIEFDRSIVSPTLVEDTLLWIPEDHPYDGTRLGDCICLLNLRSWNFRKLRGDAREQVHSFTASEDIVALMTFTHKCYVWELHGEGFKQFKVPSQDYLKTATCRERTVACAAVGAEKTSVYIWHFDSQHGQTFVIETNPQIPDDVELGPPYYDYIEAKEFLVRSTRLLLQPKTSSIIIITHAWACNVMAKIQPGSRTFGLQRALQLGPIVSSRFSYDGVCLDRSSLPLDSHFLEIRLICDYRKNYGLVPVDQQGHFTLEVACDGPEDEKRRQEFNPTSERSWSPSSTGWWNDVYFKPGEPYVQNIPDSMMYMATDAYMVGNTSGYEQHFLSIPRPGKRFRPGRDDYRACSNGSYLVRSFDSAAVVYCFDESNDRPKEDGPFFTEGVFLTLDTSVRSEPYNYKKWET
ncbi:hypothetical protein IAQ61_002715 [Plenodomus lingam]|uniref:uncharacterized protein n=1 Tax=Leptosphaeria maculans TaxID=5022 RepID=UPI003325F99A|nr:hypothetical protein IAQ61_002715 [Plenodomus lingam]